MERLDQGIAVVSVQNKIIYKSRRLDKLTGHGEICLKPLSSKRVQDVNYAAVDQNYESYFMSSCEVNLVNFEQAVEKGKDQFFQVCDASQKL